MRRKQRSEGNKGIGHKDMWEKNIPHRKNKARERAQNTERGSMRVEPREHDRGGCGRQWKGRGKLMWAMIIWVIVMIWLLFWY